MNVSLDQLHGNKVVALAAVVENKPVLVSSFQLEVDIHQVVSLHLGSSQVGVVRGERDRFVYGVLQMLELHIPYSLTKLSSQLLPHLEIVQSSPPPHLHNQFALGALHPEFSLH